MEDAGYSEDVTVVVDEMAEEIWKILFSLGPIKKEVAFRQSVVGLFRAGLITDPEPSQGSDTYHLIQMALNAAVEYGFLDIPREDCYRAILSKPEDLEPEDWKMCLTNAMEDEVMNRNEAIRLSAEWAERNIGLQLHALNEQDPVWRQLDLAINQAIRDKAMKQTIFYGVEKLQLIN
jgi:hypothetical protein